ncbi:hypothetical protein H310_07825 [Aphanomyces invadans]|uniref:Uncharacterized protein n=1 Tax=Aphanomyces invadans TaxID=157072 RepID=A0A024U1K8_9STRA|nr:hypothetical protein H310_07825 [Aphanomyces invadans]ETV99776.1 hypothetical protein H310_07825 [Aphanomyces invadans]RHY19901.1 hypothetical protein DYB32_010148 [Aphanomyces invadans]|eukprot:XP_008871552.1 hypothetical protein H310_07825 [Aphanomyces invadans]
MSASSSCAATLSHGTVKRKKAVYAKDYLLEYEQNRLRVLAEQQAFFQRTRESHMISRKEHQREKRNAYQRERRRLKKLKELQLADDERDCCSRSTSSTASDTSDHLNKSTSAKPIELSISFLLNP